MSKKEKVRPSQMSIRVLLTLLQHPSKYNRTQLADKVGISRYRINEYLNALEEEGIAVDNRDTRNGKISVLPDDTHPELRNILAMDKSDMADISRALDYLGSSHKKEYLRRKLDKLFDFQKLGLRSLRKPHLDKMDKLQESIKKKKRAILVNYRSNSNIIKDRIVECIAVEPHIGTVQVYDIDRMDVRHFKLDRIAKVEIQETAEWEYESVHHKKETDDFRIANDDQIYVHLTLNVKAYNLILDTYPQTNNNLMANDDGTFDYAAKVNKDFLGLAPFILANAAQITIHEPQSLKDAIIDMADRAKYHVRNSHI